MYVCMYVCLYVCMYVYMKCNVQYNVRTFDYRCSILSPKYAACGNLALFSRIVDSSYFEALQLKVIYQLTNIDDLGFNC